MSEDDARDDAFEAEPIHSEGPRQYVPLDFTSSGRKAGGGDRTARDRASSVWWLFLPVLLLLSFALWQRTQARVHPAGYDEPDAPDSLSAAGAVSGWDGRVELAQGGGTLALRLEPLHPRASRQAFDASALAARFRRGGAQAVPGAQPWRLSLHVAEGESEAAAGVAISDLSGVRIDGLEPLVPILAPSHDGAIVDPLLTLFGFPAVALRAGESCDLVFWGPRPGDGVAVTAPGLDEPATLRMRERSVSSESAAIARLDAREPARTTSAGEGR